MLIKSVNVTFSILRAFVGRRKPLTLKEIGYQSGLPASKAHRYLQSLIREGMIAQDPRTRLYRLGTAAIDLGLEALENSDPVVQACETVRPLAEEFDVAISIDVLGPTGPICIWYEQPITHFTQAVRLGSTQPLLASAAGQVFLAYLPRHVTRALAEVESGAVGAGAQENADALARSVQGQGYACLGPRPGTSLVSLAAPVLDARGTACAAITFHARQDAAGEVDDRIVLALLRAANDASAFKNFSRRIRLAEAV